MERKALGEPLTSERLNASRNASHAALDHWFVRNRGVQRQGWEVNYQPTYYFENLQCPTGLSDVYWDTLAAAERRWSAPVHKQLEQADQRKFAERVVTTTGSFARATQTMATISPMRNGVASGPIIDPGAHSEPALLRLLPPVTKEIKPVAVADADQNAGSGKVLPFPSGLSRWKEAGNW